MEKSMDMFRVKFEKKKKAGSFWWPGVVSQQWTVSGVLV
jgi:hypothetical protein